MIIGCGEWGFRELPLEEHFKIAKELGFGYLEFGIGGDQVGRLPEVPSPEDIATLRSLGEQYRISTPFCCIENDFTLSNFEAHEEMMARVERQIHAAADCGTTHLRLFAGFTRIEEMTEALWSQMFRAFEYCDELCAEHGMLIAIETHGAITVNEDGSMTHADTVTTHREALARMVTELPPRVGFNYDPGNIRAVHPDDDRYCLDLIDQRINYCHLKDWGRNGSGWLPGAPGDFELDYRKLLAAMNFDGVYLIEYEPVEDILEGLRRSLAYLRKISPDCRF